MCVKGRGADSPKQLHQSYRQSNFWRNKMLEGRVGQSWCYWWRWCVCGCTDWKGAHAELAAFSQRRSWMKPHKTKVRNLKEWKSGKYSGKSGKARSPSRKKVTPMVRKVGLRMETPASSTASRHLASECSLPSGQATAGNRGPRDAHVAPAGYSLRSAAASSCSNDFIFFIHITSLFLSTQISSSFKSICPSN